MATALKAIATPSPLAVAFSAITDMRAAVAAALTTMDSFTQEARVPQVLVALNERDEFTISVRVVKVEDRDLAILKLTHGMIPGYRFSNIQHSVASGSPGQGRLVITATVETE